MKDIDFDELDKAVSSVLSGGQTATTAKDKVAAKEKAETPVSDEKSHVADAVEPVKVELVEKPAPLQEEVAPTVDKPAPPAAVADLAVNSQTVSSSPLPAISSSRKAGRFMDVVHPSSDMATQSKRVSMAGRTLHPLGADVAKEKQPEIKNEPEHIQASDTPVEGVGDEPQQPETAEVTTRPEPIAAETVPAQPVPATTSIAASAPPFLNDAKVEKRPLGAFSDEPPLHETPEGGHEADREMPAPSAAPQATALPPELEMDIISVEAGTDRFGTESDDQAHNAGIPHAATINGTMSIPKQYQEVEQHADESAHSLFDTNEYHPPLNVHADGGHRFLWFWILMAVVLLLGTAGVFAFWYMQNL